MIWRELFGHLLWEDVLALGHKRVRVVAGRLERTKRLRCEAQFPLRILAVVCSTLPRLRALRNVRANSTFSRMKSSTLDGGDSTRTMRHRRLFTRVDDHLDVFILDTGINVGECEPGLVTGVGPVALLSFD